MTHVQTRPETSPSQHSPLCSTLPTATLLCTSSSTPPLPSSPPCPSPPSSLRCPPPSFPPCPPPLISPPLLYHRSVSPQVRSTEQKSLSFNIMPIMTHDYIIIPEDLALLNCRSNLSGGNYGGRSATTARGERCLPWEAVRAGINDSAVLDGAGSLCRSPDFDRGGPWCYVTADGQWDYCDIPPCGR